MSDFYQNLAENESASDADSQVSEVDPDQMAAMLKGMDDMDNDLFGSALKTKKSSDVKSPPQTATSSKQFQDFDEDDPLAGLLSDKDDTPPSRKKIENLEFGAEKNSKVEGSDFSAKVFGQVTSPTNNEPTTTGQGTSSGLDWLNAKPSSLNRADNSSLFGLSVSGQSATDLTRGSQINKPQGEENGGILNLLNDDTKPVSSSNPDKNSKRSFLSDIFGENALKASPSTDAISGTPAPSTRVSTGPSAADWLGLTDGDASSLGNDLQGSSAGDADRVGRRPRTAAVGTVTRQETRPKTAAAAAPRPREGRGDELKTPKSILESFMNDYETPTIPAPTMDTESSRPSAQKSGYTPSGASAGREPRRGGRRPSLGLPDPLGLFTNTQSEQSSQSTEAVPQPTAPKVVTETPVRVANKPPNPPPVTATASSSQLPLWLGGGASQGSDTASATVPQNPPPSSNSAIQVADPGPLLNSMSQMETSYSEVMAQQMQGLTAALSLRRQEEAMAALQMRQASLIRQYEQQLNELMQRQIQRQQQMEQTMSQQQEQIQKHIEALISQPTNPHPFITHSQLFMPKQENNQLPSLPEAQDSVAELKLKNLRLENEKHEFEALMEKERKRYEDRLYDLEEGYRKQIAALESLLEKQEKRMIQEREEIEKETIERIARLKEEHSEASQQQAERMAALHAEWLSDLRRLGEFHKEAVEMLRSEQTSAVEHWNEMKTSELNLIRDSASNTQALKQAIAQLHDSSESLQHIKSTLMQEENKQQQEREAALHERESQVTALQQTLDKEIANVATERAKLTSLARELEERIAKQKEDSDRNLKAVESKENAWRQEKEEVSNALKEERLRLQELRVEAESEIKQLSSQKAELSTEVTRLEIEKKVTQESIDQRLQQVKKMEEEARASLAAAQEKAAEAKRDQEIVKSEQKAVVDQRTQYASRAHELDTLAKQVQQDAMAAEEARAEGVAALAEARRLEREHADNAAELTRQIALLKEREQLLCQEKVSLSMEWKKLRDNRARGLCLQCSQHISAHHGNHIRRTPPKDVVDPLPIIMRLRAERGSEFSDFDLPDQVPSVLDVISQ